MIHLLYWLRKIYLFFTRPITVGVRAMLIQDKKVLLVKHVYQDGWFMPGGGMKRNETLEQAARREAQEEAGAELRNLDLLGVFSNFAEWKSDHIALFLCEDFTMTEYKDSEIMEKRFFPLDQLPENIAPGHQRHLLEYQAGSKHVKFGKW